MIGRTKDQELGDQLRRSLKRFMEDRGLSARQWAKRAGVPEGAIRNFLTGRSNTLTHLTLRALATAADVSLGALVSETEDWARTETIRVNQSVTAEERPGRSMAMASPALFTVRIPIDERLKSVEKFGALVEDDSANEIWPKGSVLICAELPLLSDEGRKVLTGKPGDFFITLETATRYSNEQNGALPFTRSNVRKLVQDDGCSYLVSCVSSPARYSAIKLPYSILNTINTDLFDIYDALGRDLELMLTGKVIASVQPTQF